MTKSDACKNASIFIQNEISDRQTRQPTLSKEFVKVSTEGPKNADEIALDYKHTNKRIQLPDRNMPRHRRTYIGKHHVYSALFTTLHHIIPLPVYLSASQRIPTVRKWIMQIGILR